eukprot:15366089-Ditylum_brightwellii.AAC.1
MTKSNPYKFSMVSNIFKLIEKIGHVLINDDFNEMLLHNERALCIDALQNTGRSLMEITSDSIDILLHQVIVLLPYYFGGNEKLLNKEFNFDGMVYELWLITGVFDEMNGKWRGEIFSRHSRQFSRRSFQCRNDIIVRYIDGFLNIQSNLFLTLAYLRLRVADLNFIRNHCMSHIR